MDKNSGFFECVFNAALRPIIIFSSKCEFLFLNEQAEKLFQYTNQQIINTNISRIIPHSLELMKFIRNRNTNTKSSKLVLSAIKKDHTKIYVNFAVSKLKFKNRNYYIAIINEEDNEHRNLNQIVNSAGEGIYGVDLNGNTTFVNPAACKILGYTAEELIGSPMHDKIHYKYPNGSIYPRTKCYMYAAYIDGKTHRINDEVLWRKDGNPVSITYTSTPIYEQGKICGAVVIFLDTTVEKTILDHMAHIEKLKEQYIAGVGIRELYTSSLKYILELTKSTYGLIATIKPNENIKNTLLINSLILKNKLELKEDLIDIAKIDKRIRKSLLTGKPIIITKQSCYKNPPILPVINNDVSSLLCIPILGADGLIATMIIANSSDNYNDDTIKQLTFFTGTLSSIIESNNNYSVIDDIAKSDFLTKLYNRSYFEEQLVKLIQIYNHSNKKFCILLVNLDNFKRVNNIYGHLAGDKILENFASILISSVKKTDCVARIGGDEFSIVLQDIKNYKNAENIANKIMKLSLKHYKIGSNMIKCAVNIGIVGYPKSGHDKEQLMKRVNFALYHAKEKDSHVAFFTETLENKYIRQRLLEYEIEKGFDKKQFYCVFHPQVNLDNQEIFGVEVLLRWSHPTLGEISPMEFIPIIERLGKSMPLNIFVVTETLNKMSKVKSNTPLKVSINISPQVRNFSEHIKNILSLLEKSKSSTDIKYCLELTESCFEDDDFNNYNDLNKTFNLLAKNNVDFAIDDFGIEHSSISRLISYKFTILKIDQIFVKRLDNKNDNGAMAVIKAIMSLSHDLGFSVIAEGVETTSQIHILKTLGCKMSQGFYYYKPLEFSTLLKVLDKNRYIGQENG